MHEGRMIFTGSMREMQQRLKRDVFRLDLDGSAEDIQRLVQQVNSLAGIEATVGTGDTLSLQLADGVSRASALSDVLKLVATSNLTLQNVHSGRNETEDVYLQLLQEDEAHGFQRFTFEADSRDDAIHGDSLA
jgi:hypothetical protein